MLGQKPPPHPSPGSCRACGAPFAALRAFWQCQLQGTPHSWQAWRNANRAVILGGIPAAAAGPGAARRPTRAAAVSWVGGRPSSSEGRARALPGRGHVLLTAWAPALLLSAALPRTQLAGGCPQARCGTAGGGQQCHGALPAQPRGRGAARARGRGLSPMTAGGGRCSQHCHRCKQRCRADAGP